MEGQTGNTLTCDVSGDDRLNPTITYQWTKYDGSTRIQVGTNSNMLTLDPSPLQLSNAGDYMCSVTVRSSLLNNDIMANSSHRVMIQSELTIINNTDISHSIPTPVPNPLSVTITSTSGNIIHNGSNVILKCAVELDPAVMEPEISLLIVKAQLFREGILLETLADKVVTGTTFTYTTQLSSFSDNDVGNYTCTATIRPKPTSTYLTGTGQQKSNTIELAIGE